MGYGDEEAEMAQWLGIGLAGVKRAQRAPARLHKKLRERRPFRRRNDPPEPRPEDDIVRLDDDFGR